MLRRAQRLHSVWRQALQAPTRPGEPWSLPAFASASAAPNAAGSPALRSALKYLAGAGAALWATQQEEVGERAQLAWLICTRLARDVYTAAAIVAG
jgi:hypothetical protein